VDGAAAERVRGQARAAQTAYLLDPDGAAGRAYGAKTTPHMYVIDSKGVLRYAGGIDSIPSPNPPTSPRPPSTCRRPLRNSRREAGQRQRDAAVRLFGEVRELIGHRKAGHRQMFT
jgi:hypothetical protein